LRVFKNRVVRTIPGPETGDSRLEKLHSEELHNLYILKLKLFHYTPWRRLGGEEI
jgi:hypothetical protein